MHSDLMSGELKVANARSFTSFARALSWACSGLSALIVIVILSLVGITYKDHQLSIVTFLPSFILLQTASFWEPQSLASYLDQRPLHLRSAHIR